MAGPETFKVDLPGIENWTLSKFERGGGLAVVAVNSGMRAFAAREFFPFQLTISIDAAELGSSGLPTPREEQALNTVGRTLDEIVLRVGNAAGAPLALYLARSTWNAVHERVFRVHDPAPFGGLLTIAAREQGWVRPWRFEQQLDEDWALAAPYLATSERK